MIENNIYKIRTNCGICGHDSFKTIMHYGEVPLAGNFPTEMELHNDKKYNLDLLFCSNCGLVQTNSIIESDVLFRDYRYMSSIGLKKHFIDVAAMLKNRFNPKKVLEIGANDGCLLKPLNDLSIETIGFDPAINVAKSGIDKGCNIIVDYFNENSATKYGIENDFDIVVANNCFAHIEDLHSIVKGVKNVLKKNGHFIIEVHYVRDLIEQIQYDTVYHEHLYYHSISSLRVLFEKYEMTIVDVEEIPIHGGSIRVFVKNNNEDTNQKMIHTYSMEKNIGLLSFDFYKKFGDTAIDHIKKVKELLIELKKDNKKIIGYGASGRGNIFCNLCNITPDIVDYIIDESPERTNRYIAGVHIPIVTPDHINGNEPDYIFIFAWNYSKMIINKFNDKNYKFIIVYPKIIITDKHDAKLLDSKLYI